MINSLNKQTARTGAQDCAWSRLGRLVDSSPTLLTLEQVKLSVASEAEAIEGAECLLDPLRSISWEKSEIRALNLDSIVEMKSRVEPLLEAVDDLFYVTTGNRLKERTLDRARSNYIVYSFQNELESWFKWNTVYLASLLFKEERLPLPKYKSRPGVVMGGAFFRYTRSLLKRGVCEKVLFWGGSVLQLKRAAQPIPNPKIRKSIDDHQKFLGEERPNEHRDAVKYVLSELINSIFRKDIKTPWVLPSSSAHYGVSRKDAGALGLIHSNFIVPEGLNLLSKSLVGYTKNSPNSGGPMAVYVPVLYETLANDLRKIALSESRDCEVHTILEPCKVRTITAGPSYRYQVARTVQKRVFRQLRNNRFFQLCGRPLSPEILNSHYSGMPTSLCAPGRGLFVSADYSSATDLLDGQLGEYAVQLIGDALGLDEQTFQVYKESMTGHVMHYPSDFGGDTVVQRNGQLMGSPSSFPVLCLVNAAILVAAWLEYQDDWEFKAECHPTLKSAWKVMEYLRPLVNGDDLLFRCPTGGFYDFWWDYATTCGLKPSAGKNYTSERMCTLNSEYYLVRESEQFGRYYFNERWRYAPPSYSYTFSKIPWFNTGLARGQSKVISDTRKLETDTVDWTSVGAKLHKLLSGLEGKVRRRAEEVWFSYNRKVLFSTDRSWRLPVILGGLGLPLSGEAGPGATRPQLALAHYIIKSGDDSFRTENLAVGSDLQDEIYRQQRNIIKRFCYEARRYSETYEIVDGMIREYRTVDISSVPTYLVSLSADPLARVKKVKRHKEFKRRMEAKLKSVNIGPCDLEGAIEYQRFRCWIGDVEFPTLDVDQGFVDGPVSQVTTLAQPEGLPKGNVTVEDRPGSNVEYPEACA